MKRKSYLSSLLVRARLQLGLTQKEMASRLGISEKSWLCYEEDVIPPVHILNQLKVWLGGAKEEDLFTVLQQHKT